MRWFLSPLRLFALRLDAKTGAKHPRHPEPLLNFFLSNSQRQRAHQSAPTNTRASRSRLRGTTVLSLLLVAACGNAEGEPDLIPGESGGAPTVETGSGGAKSGSGGTSAGSGGATSGAGGATSGSGGRFTIPEPGTGGRENEEGSGGADTSGTGGLVLGEIPRFVGNITTRDTVDTDGFTYADYWDQITPENAGKWGSIQRSAGAQFNWNTLDAIYDYALEHNIVFKQHAFVWGTQQPSGNLSEADVKGWISAFCERYPATRLIDVVNEPPPHTTPSYVNAIGGGTNGNWQWITNAFKWARESCPNAILILNDFNNIEWSNDNNHFIGIVKTVLSNGGPIDAVGAQAHDLDNGAVSFNTVDSLLNKLHNDTGLPVYITELDLSYTDDNQQLQSYQRYFPYFREKEFIPGITIWGWIYGKTWSQAANSGLIRNGASRSAMTYLMNELGRPVP